MWTGGSAANGCAMLGRFLSCMVMLSLVIGAILATASARSEPMTSPHGSELLLLVDHATTSDHGDDHPPREDGPCAVVSHHHCSFALAVEPSTPRARVASRGRAILPAASAAMTSFSQAPPTEPPAA